MNRWYLTIATTSCVVLFTICALVMLEQGNEVMASVFLFFAFATPLSDEAMRGDLLKLQSESESDAAVDQATDGKISVK